MACIALGCAREPLPAENDQEEKNVQDTIQTIIPGQATVKFDDAMIELIESDLAAGNIVTKSSELNSLKDMLGIMAKVKLVAPKTIARSEGKAVRIIDKRKI